MVYFNSRTISYFVQQPYEAGFKICGEKRKQIGLMLGHHFQSTSHSSTAVQGRLLPASYLGSSQDPGGSLAKESEAVEKH